MNKRLIFLKLFLGLFLGAFFCVQPFSFSAEVRVVASVDRTQVAVGENVYLTIKVLDGRGNIPAPQLPQLQDLEIHYTGRASRMSLVNGVSSSSLEFSYVVSPRRKGVYVIPALALT